MVVELQTRLLLEILFYGVYSHFPLWPVVTHRTNSSVSCDHCYVCESVIVWYCGLSCQFNQQLRKSVQIPRYCNIFIYFKPFLCLCNGSSCRGIIFPHYWSICLYICPTTPFSWMPLSICSNLAQTSSWTEELIN